MRDPDELVFSHCAFKQLEDISFKSLEFSSRIKLPEVKFAKSFIVIMQITSSFVIYIKNIRGLSSCLYLLRNKSNLSV